MHSSLVLVEDVLAMDSFWNSLQEISLITFDQILIRILVAVVFGFAVALVYRFSHGRKQPDRLIFATTLILLSSLIAMVSMVIGDSVARAFGLVGALSIVRFRTVVDDTRDTAFVMFAVIVGMAAGTGLFIAPLVGIPIIGVIAWCMDQWGSASESLDGLVAVRGGVAVKIDVRQALGEGVTEQLQNVLNSVSTDCRILRSSTSKQGTSVDMLYLLHMRSEKDLPNLVLQLNRIEGIQSVDGRVVSKENA